MGATLLTLIFGKYEDSRLSKLLSFNLHIPPNFINIENNIYFFLTNN